MNANARTQPDRHRHRPRTGAYATPARPARRGFTLIELTIVMVIIGIIVSFVLVASYEGLERAKERATQALITKIDQGLNDRIDGLMAQDVDSNGAHQFLAAVMPSGFTGGSNPLPWGLSSDQRAHVIAMLDYLKAEMPDVFYVDLTTDPVYPLNFAGVAYPGDTYPGANNREKFLLPIGYSTIEGYLPNSYLNPATNVGPYNAGAGANYVVDPTAKPPLRLHMTPSGATGIYGASYTARAAFMKLLGASNQACDAVDNDGNGYVDELTPAETGMTATDIAAILTKLGKHKHKTARSECLYALLVGGIGPLGSTFSADDFKSSEVADTDGDGLPEFVDGWGEPIQFYRWPTHYISGIQHGWGPYASISEARESSPLDPNGQLVAPAWWSAQFNGLSSGSGAAADLPKASDQARMVMSLFLNVADWQYPTAAGNTGILWDRSGTMPRREYFIRPLVVSSGPDKMLGIAQLGFDYTNYGEAGALNVPVNASNLILIENTASNLSPVRGTFSAANPYPPVTSDPVGNKVAQDMQTNWGLDDISNQTLQTSNGGVK